MPQITAKAKRVGGSLMVTLPTDVVDVLGVAEGEVVELTILTGDPHFRGTKGAEFLG